MRRLRLLNSREASAREAACGLGHRLLWLLLLLLVELHGAAVSGVRGRVSAAAARRLLLVGRVLACEASRREVGLLHRRRQEERRA